MFYSPHTKKVVGGFKNGRIEGIGGKHASGDRCSYDTAMRESIEELTGISIDFSTLDMSQAPDPVCCFITNGDYEIFVYTYDDYATIATIINVQKEAGIPRTINEVLATQHGTEHRFLAEVSYDFPEEYDVFLHDYFAKDLRLLAHALTYDGYFQTYKSVTEQGESLYQFECVVEQASVIYTDSYMSVSSSNDSEELEAFVTEFVRIMRS